MSAANLRASVNAEHDEIDQLLQSWMLRRRSIINEADSKRILAKAGFPVPGGSQKGAAAVKFCADGALHKSELGLVALDVAPNDIEQQMQNLHKRSREAGLTDGEILVESMITGALMEWFVGCRVDDTFGPIVVIGAGGIYAELLGEPEIRTAPLSCSDAELALKHHRAFSIINGARGKEPADIRAFAKLISDISEFFYRRSHIIAELDLNPIMVRGERTTPNLVIADASIILQRPSG